MDRVIHSRGQVSLENIEKVNTIIKEYGYQKNIFASNLAFNKKFHFAVLLPNSDGIEFWNLPLQGIKKAEQEFARFGILIDYYFYDYDSHSFKVVAEKIFKKKYEGLLFAPVFFNESKAFLEKCSQKNLKTVLIDSTISENNEVAFTGQSALQSGVIAGKLCSINLDKTKSILIIKITREIENTSIYLQRIKGFYSFFENNSAYSSIQIKEINIKDFENNKLKPANFENVSAVFVPNSRSYIVADFLKENNIQDINLVGYDLLEKNLKNLEEGYIDFLINQKPDQQGYVSIEYLYKTVVLKENVASLQKVPIEIIIKENMMV